MKPRRFGLGGILLGLFIAVPVSADQAPGAPPGQYDKFSLQDSAIIDLKTGLLWLRSASPAPIDFATAAASCPKPSGGTAFRLPTLKELLTLVDEQPHLDYDPKSLKNVQKMIDPAAFGKQTPVDQPYWSSSMDGGTKAWTVDFGSGATSSTGLNDSRYVRCVSAAPP